MDKPHHKFSEKEPTIINDDGEAQTIMFQLGVWDYVKQRGKPTSTLSILCAETHPTHWCICAQHFDNPNPDENGFQVIAFPKKLVDPMTVNAYMLQHMSSATDVTFQPFEYKGS